MKSVASFWICLWKRQAQYEKRVVVVRVADVADPTHADQGFGSNGPRHPNVVLDVQSFLEVKRFPREIDDRQLSVKSLLVDATKLLA